MNKYTTYLAGGWFNDQQMSKVQNAEKLLGTVAFSPRQHQLEEFKFGTLEWCIAVFRNDVKYVYECPKFFFATDDDLGTIWELGLALYMKREFLNIEAGFFLDIVNKFKKMAPDNNEIIDSYKKKGFFDYNEIYQKETYISDPKSLDMIISIAFLWGHLNDEKDLFTNNKVKVLISENSKLYTTNNLMVTESCQYINQKGETLNPYELFGLVE